MKLIKTLIGTFALVGGLSSAAVADTTKTFPAGSLIIPASSVFQTDCGAVSMYGLVYNVLRANKWLDNDPGYAPIEIYYSYEPNKTSGNRCTPTNKHTNPGTTAQQASASWLDGCDFSLTGTGNLVTRVNNVSGSDTTVTTYNTSGKSSYVYPTYNSTQAITAANGVTTVRYSGGSFIIDASDAATFISLIRGSIPAKDKGVTIQYGNFRAPVDGSGNPTCTYGTTVGGYVNIHRSTVAFTAPIPKIFTAAPPRLALLSQDKDNITGTISDGILQGYLLRAGLQYTGAQGCPAGGVYATNTTVCPNGGVSGDIYDVFDFKDIQNDKLSLMSSGENTYKMLWAPHWGLTARGTGPSTTEKAVIAKISAFLDGQTGLMAECASIEALEGSQNGIAGPEAKFQTCHNDGTNNCDATFVNQGTTVTETSSGSSNLRNCSDITLSDGGACYYIGYPGDSYVQFGDFQWLTMYGTVQNYLPRTASTSIYRAGVTPLVSGVSNRQIALLGTPAAARSSGLLKDFVTRNQKENDSNKGNILYLGGHDLRASVAGTKVVLQTLLQLGSATAPPTTDEVSRAMPIIALLGSGEAMVQGTFVSNTPAGNPKKLLINGDADTFEFPFIEGHLRAYTGVSTTATSFETLASSVAWDAADQIPVGNYAGCTAYTGACRTVFTNLDLNCRRDTTQCTSTVFSDSTAPSLGAVMASDLDDAAKLKLVRRTIEGEPDTSVANGYRARLGGIDRSTVAVIPQSSLAGVGTRPTMVYVGGTDGMMHAICGDTTAPCTTVGMELWAFMPRNQLTSVRQNTTRIDGSPRVQDIYGDFEGTGKSFRTVMVFQTGSGDSATTATTPAIYAVDVTFPGEPKLLWEHTTPGRGLAITMGRITTGQYAAFVQTNSGTTAAGTTVLAIDIETGETIWSNTLTYPAPRDGTHATVPTSGIPGGAVGIDMTGSGNMTDVVITTLYGQIYRLNASTGVNPYDPSPLFQFSEDFKPFGGAPAIFQQGTLYAVAASGGYTEQDPATNQLWTSTSVMQQAVAVSLSTPVASAPLTEATTPSTSGLKFAYNLGTGNLAFSQVQVIGDQIFLTTDTTDVNASTYGTTGAATGNAHRLDLNGGSATVVAIAGGAAGLGHSGTTTYAASSDKAQQLSSLTAASATASEGINTNTASKVSRRLWLRTL